MRQSLLVLIAIIGMMFADRAKAQEYTIHSYAAVLEDHPVDVLQHPQGKHFRKGMTYGQWLHDVTQSINEELLSSPFVKSLGDGDIEITDYSGAKFQRQLFDEEMTRDMISNHSFRIDGDDLGEIPTAGWTLNNKKIEMVWKPRSIFKYGVGEGAMAFSIGDFYQISTMVGVRQIYQLTACMNPAKRTLYKKKWLPVAPVPPDSNYVHPPIGPQPKPVVLGPDEGNEWKTKRTIKRRFFYKKVKHWHYKVINGVDSLVRVDTVTRLRPLPFFIFGAANVLGVAIVDNGCKNNWWRGGNGNSNNTNTQTPPPDSSQTTTNIPTGTGHREAAPQQTQSPKLVLYRFHTGKQYVFNPVIEKRLVLPKQQAVPPIQSVPKKLNLGFSYQAGLNFTLGSKKPFGEVFLQGLTTFHFGPALMMK